MRDGESYNFQVLSSLENSRGEVEKKLSNTKTRDISKTEISNKLNEMEANTDGVEDRSKTALCTQMRYVCQNS